MDISAFRGYIHTPWILSSFRGNTHVPWILSTFCEYIRILWILSAFCGYYLHWPHYELPSSYIFHFIHSFVQVADLIFGHITSYLARNIRHFFTFYSSSESDWCTGAEKITPVIPIVLVLHCTLPVFVASAHGLGYCNTSLGN